MSKRPEARPGETQQPNQTQYSHSRKVAAAALMVVGMAAGIYGCGGGSSQKQATSHEAAAPATPTTPNSKPGANGGSASTTTPNTSPNPETPSTTPPTSASGAATGYPPNYCQQFTGAIEQLVPGSTFDRSASGLTDPASFKIISSAFYSKVQPPVSALNQYSCEWHPSTGPYASSVVSAQILVDQMSRPLTRSDEATVLQGEYSPSFSAPSLSGIGDWAVQVGTSQSSQPRIEFRVGLYDVILVADPGEPNLSDSAMELAAKKIATAIRG